MNDGPPIVENVAPPSASPGPAARSLRAKRGAADWIVALWIVWALAGLAWTPYDPQAQLFYDQRPGEMTASHWFGVDDLGRDVFSRVWRGTGNTVVLGSLAAAGTLFFASLLLVFERRGPRAMRKLVRALVSAGLALPVLFVGLVLLVFLPQSRWTLVLACALGGVPFGFRQLRVMWIEQAGALHVLASRALGATRLHIAWFAIWPNLRGQAVSLAKLLFAAGVLELSGLSYLGLTGDPDFAELGSILKWHQKFLLSGQPALVLWPGLLLSGLLLSVHLSNIRAHASRDASH